MTSVELPSPVTYGTIKCNVGKLVGDITGAPTPDISMITGKCRISPVGITNMTVLSPSGNYILATPPEEWSIIAGKLVSKTGAEGVRYVASTSPGKFPERVQYMAEFFIEGILKKYQPKPRVFDVPANGIIDLALIVSSVVEPPVIKVNSYEDRVAVQLALADAQNAVADAVDAATSASISAQAAAASAADAHAAIIVLQGANTPVPPGTPTGTVVVHVA